MAPLALLPVALAFGLAAMAMGVWSAGRMPTSDVPGYIVSQYLDGIFGAAILYMIRAGRMKGYDLAAGGLGQNGFGPGVLDEYTIGAAFLTEFVGAFIFLVAIPGATPKLGSGSRFSSAAMRWRSAGCSSWRPSPARRSAPGCWTPDGVKPAMEGRRSARTGGLCTPCRPGGARL